MLNFASMMMRSKIFIFLITLMTVQPHAFASLAIENNPEEAPEFIEPRATPSENLISPYVAALPVIDRSLAPELNKKALQTLGSPDKWAFQFVFVHRDGQKQIISEHRANMPVQPASTIKLFTGWLGFTQHIDTADRLAFMLKHSDNPIANDTLRRAGGPERMHNYFRDLGLDVNDQNFKIADGSGLAEGSLVSADLEMELLTYIHSQNQYTKFRNMLARPGAKGTLKVRLLDLKANLYGKTGTLSDSICLAGYVELEQGTLIFTVLSDHLNLYTERSSLETRAKVRNAMRARVDQVLRSQVAFAKTLKPLPQPIDIYRQSIHSAPYGAFTQSIR
jgi:D-alanyl-D-alanine carboxypeptidase